MSIVAEIYLQIVVIGVVGVVLVEVLLEIIQSSCIDLSRPTKRKLSLGPDGYIKTYSLLKRNVSVKTVQ